MPRKRKNKKPKKKYGPPKETDRFSDAVKSIEKMNLKRKPRSREVDTTDVYDRMRLTTR